MKNNEIIVTVAMSAYNHEKYVGQAIESVLMQRVNFKYEILITDDASTDRTASIIKEYAKKYPDIIRAVCRKKNLGAMENSNYRRKHALGKYLANLECDDYWTDENKLQKQINFLEKHPDYSACFTASGVIRDNTNVIQMAKRDIFSMDDYLVTGKKAINIPTATLVYRNIFRDNPKLLDYYKTNKIIGDRITHVLLLRYGKMKYLPINSAVYRHIKKKSSSFSSMSDKIRWEDTILCYRVCIKLSPIKNRKTWHILLSEIQKKTIEAIATKEGISTVVRYYIKNITLKEKYYLFKEHWI